jgi:hypothetical protein
MNARGFDYALVTRFNLPSEGAESVIRARDGWLRDRVGLFERYCVPSVRSQEDQRFEWIVYFDPESPTWLLDWIADASKDGRFHAVFRASVPRTALVEDLRRITGAGGTGIITTNLDNDDALSSSFVRRIREAADANAAQHGGDSRVAVYLENGLILGSSGAHRRRDRFNAFCSVAEGWTDPQTCWLDWHNRLPLHMESIGLRGAPGWLQVVHGSNVSNRIHGRLVSPAPHRDLFPGALEGVPVPRNGALAIDAAVREPIRLVRDGARRTLKGVALAVLGRDGLTHAKGVVAQKTAKPVLAAAVQTQQSPNLGGPQ